MIYPPSKVSFLQHEQRCQRSGATALLGHVISLSRSVIARCRPSYWQPFDYYALWF